jgi:hypothetical protein
VNAREHLAQLIDCAITVRRALREEHERTHYTLPRAGLPREYVNPDADLTRLTDLGHESIKATARCHKLLDAIIRGDAK